MSPPLPLFSPGEDPGPNFSALLARLGPAAPAGGFPTAGPISGLRSPEANWQAGGAAPRQLVDGLPHGTTVLAVRYAGGVVMAGDRRATEGSTIAYRTMDKVHPAGRKAAVAIAGTAGPAMELVRLFQTQIEHYEKVEGVALTLEGTANQLASMIRENFSMALQGLVVVPLFAGYDDRRMDGRIFTYDVVGGHYEEDAVAATGSGSRDARTTMRLGFREGMSREEALDLVARALYEAADQDSATGGPDQVRGIYPTVAVVDQAGFSYVEEGEVAQHFDAVIAARRAGRGDRS